MKTSLLISLTALCTATALFAHSGVKDPYVMKRMTAMKGVAENMKALSAIAKDPTRFDAEVIALHGGSLVEHARNIAPMFEYQAQDPKSEARDTVWTDWPGFMAQAAAMEKAAETMSAVTTQDMFKAAFTALGDTCTSCHKEYRIKK